ncbi:alternative ribosome rescue aminoacyl-tRNA hydrolase ArfB [Colwellia sp. 4_MG-2023]|uniref:alternative ribosome rescue aminoacyl-tRNA hydrolase ArfB n=1 Tax=unclassified Colwellia TaxID=196834 RepID=UPI001C093515|nr:MULTISPECIES: alternative ribosome rescue aminoacyl-tRNA hydrolase ArfB [unclassified Colwellia]MBU2925036.1 aminoacyl-tRNA hydrolase [Colwellia sp. C2M11]MDO6486441.1 alternative ribosome rescue aminoacyl-tRNA hydrolase ArfB [Colwellia sp. 6_MG-2023]MDO6506319.1 alternative ribosome rescue aminoacyl-tRNA hydrolase ArfB [Colwellia sp. 5_MG-2023]MDO6555143.1 alternative ribosome rescue aminoacyl-tRNA hydrolase ArfB [Colwellia sp. 4_MG-2023]MDO6651671.1 alternative ribosome rescue aminoacyl-t
MLEISNNVSLADWEIELSAIRSMGNGGQRVNKVATAIHLRFDINRSSLPAVYKERLLASKDSRISKDGVIIIKAQSFRTQEMNKEDAFKRLKELVTGAMIVQKKRRPTKPTKGSVQRRLTTKANKKTVKQTRQKVKF